MAFQLIILVFHLGIRKYYSNEDFGSSSFSPSSLWDLPSWFSFIQYHLLKSMVRIKARFSFLKQVCIQFLLEFSPFPLVNTSCHSILQVPRFTTAMKSSMCASVSLYVLYHTYCLFHYISHGLCYFIWLSFYMCVIFTWIDDVDSGGGQVYTWESYADLADCRLHQRPLQWGMWWPQRPETPSLIWQFPQLPLLFTNQLPPRGNQF